MFHSPEIIKAWEIKDIESGTLIVPTSLDHSLVDIKTDNENLIIRTINLQQKYSKNHSTDDQNAKHTFHPIQLGKKPQYS